MRNNPPTHIKQLGLCQSLTFTLLSNSPYSNIESMREQLNSLGLCFNWDRVSSEKYDACVFLHRWLASLILVQSANLASFHHPNYWLWCSELILPWCFLRHMFVKVTGYHVNRQLVLPVITKKIPHSSRADTTLYLAYGGKNFFSDIYASNVYWLPWFVN